MHLEWFLYLSDLSSTLSVTKTASNFFVTQQAVSTALKKLETELGVKLFIRRSRGVELTAIGKSIADNCKNIAAEYVEILDKAEHTNRTKLLNAEGEILLYIPPRLIFCGLEDILEKFYKICPKVSVKIKEYTDTSMFNKLKETRNNVVGIIFSNSTSYDISHFLNEFFSNTFAIESLGMFQQHVCLHKNNLLAQKSVITKHDIMKIPLIAYNYDSDLVSLICLEQNCENNLPQYTLSDLSMQKRTVIKNNAGMMLTKLEFDYAWKNDDDFVCKPCDFLEDINISVVYNEAESLDFYTEYLLSLFKESFLKSNN